MISTILTGIQQELGLKLDNRKMPLDLVVIDSAERTPVENYAVGGRGTLSYSARLRRHTREEIHPACAASSPL